MDHERREKSEKREKEEQESQSVDYQVEQLVQEIADTRKMHLGQVNE